ncbi:hypothetical protein [Kallotenue papyrolyticum]|uniref:hypothetical protein n=1 Tax=Kallotenue papyrolyticum TaxID=1325125 RepID=UPI0004BBB060|nr:hypothetical protein [Kallotenue papyrolyticum]
MLAIIGLGAILLGTSLGSGEWLIGPAVTARFSGVLLWIATGGLIFVRGRQRLERQQRLVGNDASSARPGVHAASPTGLPLPPAARAPPIRYHRGA